ncbi:peptidase S8/S53 domain-containing protein [Limtongia smithiae]|uniref:peptidase S8/S53 domain-containing protein n=1 Tax=Limtongia smithiae TaxID=1125753 RepID=UPI0034CF36C8
MLRTDARHRPSAHSDPAASDNTPSDDDNDDDSAFTAGGGEFDFDGPITTRAESDGGVEILPQALVDRYIIVFKPTVPDDQIHTHYVWLREQLKKIKHSKSDSWQRLFRRFSIGKSMHAYSAKLARPLAKLIAARPEILIVESDGIYALDPASHTVTQSFASYNLARISQREAIKYQTTEDPTQRRYSYKYDENPGLGVTIFVLDTGVRLTHEEFGGRASAAARLNCGMGGSHDDSSVDVAGHGTHVAATAAGQNYGVAKNASIVSVKVLNNYGSGMTSCILNGLQYVTQQATAIAQPAVINMSLGAKKYLSLNLAVEAVVAAGVHVVISAGNKRGDACEFSPASAESAITVGSSDIQDNISQFSNQGACVDVFAPGSLILSAGIRNNDGFAVMSGTSMSSPLVAGLVAYFVAKNPSMTPAEAKQQVLDLATRDALSGFATRYADNTANALVFNGYNATNA